MTSKKEQRRKKKEQYAKQLRKEIEKQSQNAQKRCLARIIQIEEKLEQKGLLDTDLASLVSSVRKHIDLPSSLGVKGKSKKEKEAFIASLVSIVVEKGLMVRKELKKILRERNWTIKEKFFQHTIEELSERDVLQTWKNIIAPNIFDDPVTRQILNFIEKNGGKATIHALDHTISREKSLIDKIIEFLCERGVLVRRKENIYLPK